MPTPLNGLAFNQELVRSTPLLARAQMISFLDVSQQLHVVWSVKHETTN
jgi:hypothetical protein